MRRRQLVAVAAAGIVLVGGGGVAYAQAQGASGSYRTATVTTGDVDETIGLAGVVSASSRRDLSFGASGTVRKVRVEAGDTVAAGDVLATLDPTDLEAAVTRAEASLAKALAQLEADQDSQATTVSDSTPSTSSGSDGDDSSSRDTKTPTPKATTSPALKAALKTLATQQTAVTTAQTAATEAITAAKTALAAQADACQVAETEVPADSDSDDAAPVGLSDECAAALDAVQSAQDVVSTRQDALQTALQALSATLTAAVTTLGESSSDSSSDSTPDSSDTATTTPAASDSSSSAAGSGSGGGGGTTVTAATLAQDQAEIDTAKAELTEAERALKAAKLTAPFAGEILSVSAAKGDAVGGSDVVMAVKGDGGSTVTTTVTLDQIDSVEQGQTATVTPAGASEPVTGSVTSISMLPATGTDGTSTYPVTIALDGEVAAPEGTTASIRLVTGTATDVLTVPSSAVSTTGRTTVSVLQDGVPVVTPVTVGVVGATRTAITKGLTRGQEVVLADLEASLPSGDSSTTSLPGGGSGFGGMRPGGQGGPG